MNLAALYGEIERRSGDQQVDESEIDQIKTITPLLHDCSDSVGGLVDNSSSAWCRTRCRRRCNRRCRIDRQAFGEKSEVLYAPTSPPASPASRRATPLPKYIEREDDHRRDCNPPYTVEVVDIIGRQIRGRTFPVKRDRVPGGLVGSARIACVQIHLIDAVAEQDYNCGRSDSR